MAAAAERDRGAAAQPEGLAFRIYDEELALDAQGPVAYHSDLGCRHAKDRSTAKAVTIMGPMRLLPALLVLGGVAGAGRHDPLLEAIRRKMSALLRRMPDYTCVETIERWKRGQPCADCRSWERLRLEVAVIGGKERFAWPGAAQFEDREIEQIVPPGAIGTGDFSGFAAAVFLSEAAEFEGPFEDRVDGAAAWRYSYRVPPAASRYTLRDGLNSLRVAYRGAFWVDRQSLDLMRLDVEADGLPAPPLQIASARTTIRYQRLPMGASPVLLPVSSELVLTDTSGRTSRNRTSFGHCRQYTGSSAVRFDEPASLTAGSPDPRERRRLPPGLSLELRLAGPVDPESAAAGDAVEAVLARDLRSEGTLWALRGARVIGRLLSVRHITGPRSGVGLLALEFTRLETSTFEAEFRSRLEMLGGVVPGARKPADVAVAGQENTLVFYGRLLRLPRGLPMRWTIVH